MNASSRLALFLLFSVPLLLDAAPQKRGCHFSEYSSDLPTAAIPSFQDNIIIEPITDFDPQPTESLPEASFDPSLAPTPTTSDDNLDEPATPTTDFGDTNTNAIPTRNRPFASNADFPTDEPTSTTTDTYTEIDLDTDTITPKIVLIYPNATYTLSTQIMIPALTLNLSTQVLAKSTDQAPAPTPFQNLTTVEPIPDPTIQTNPTFTTPDLDAMQTAYYLDVCTWEEHLDDAICLGGNTMMCCRSDNERCSPTLQDGGLSCQGIESGNWAKVWTRPTVTLGVVFTSTKATPSIAEVTETVTAATVNSQGMFVVLDKR